MTGDTLRERASRGRVEEGERPFQGKTGRKDRKGELYKSIQRLNNFA